MNNLLNDQQLSDLVSMSKSWIRKQRMLRRRGESHTLTIDPVLIGTAPRYRQAEVLDWLNSLGGAS